MWAYGTDLPCAGSSTRAGGSQVELDQNDPARSTFVSLVRPHFDLRGDSRGIYAKAFCERGEYRNTSLSPYPEISFARETYLEEVSKCEEL